MTKLPFLERLKQKPLLSDGAMGTMLYQAGLHSSRCFDQINLTDPQLVGSIHERYLLAGSEIIETNTFSANEYKLREFGLEDQVVEINEAGVELAKRALEKTGRQDAYIAGAVGPLGVWIEPIGRVTEEKAFAAFRRQIATLIYSGVDAIVLETFSDINEMLIAVRAARDVNPNIPIVAQFTFTRDDRTVLGDTPVTVAEALLKAEVNVLGINCSSGPAQLLRIASVMKNIAPDVLLSVQPNAGWPEQVGGRVVYPASAEYFGEYALAFAQLGIGMIGGCCGTTPDHIHAMRQALDDENRVSPIYISVPKPEDAILQTPIEQPTRMMRKLAAGEFITTVEMAPPRSFTAQRVVAAAEMLRDAGITFVNVSDAPLARMRMSPWAVAYLIQEQAEMETVLHFPVRGRNMLRIQGDLLAAHAMNIRNIFVTMGDPTKIGDYPEAFDTHDIVPTGLINLLQNRFNHGLDHAGNSIGQATRFNVGAALNMGAKDLPKEIELTRKKIDNGANFFLTQPIFEVEKVRTFLRAYEETYEEAFPLPIVAGLLPLFTPRHAAFLHNEVPGVEIPPDLLERINNASDAAAEGVRIAQELLLELREIVQGAYFMPPFGRYYLAAEVVEVLKPELAI